MRFLPGHAMCLIMLSGRRSDLRLACSHFSAIQCVCMSFLFWINFCSAVGPDLRLCVDLSLWLNLCAIVLRFSEFFTLLHLLLASFSCRFFYAFTTLPVVLPSPSSVLSILQPRSQHSGAQFPAAAAGKALILRLRG